MVQQDEEEAGEGHLAVVGAEEMQVVLARQVEGAAAATIQEQLVELDPVESMGSRSLLVTWLSTQSRETCRLM